MPINPEIALQIKPPEFMSPQQMVALKDIATQQQMRNLALQKAQFDARNQQGIRSALAEQGAIDPETGFPTAVTLGKIAALDPGTAMEYRQQQLQADRTRAELASTKATEQKNVQALQEKRLEVTQQVKGSALAVYDNALERGIAPEQAKRLAQEHLNERIAEVKKSGILGDVGDPKNPNFDADQFRAEALNYKDMQSQKETKRHNVAMEDAARRRESRIEGDGEGLTDDAIDLIADQALAGDRSGLQNVGRGTQGAKDLRKIRNRIAERGQERGMSGGDVAVRSAEFEGEKAGQRAIGQRLANTELAVTEADKMIPLALEASEKMPRGRWTSINKIEGMAKNEISPEMGAFKAANNSFLNVYARAVKGGVPGVTDTEHARELLSTADSKERYVAIMNQLKKELQAALESPTDVKRSMRDRFKDEGGGQAAPATRPKKGDVVDGYRYTGGDPGQKASWEPL